MIYFFGERWYTIDSVVDKLNITMQSFFVFIKELIRCRIMFRFLIDILWNNTSISEENMIENGRRWNKNLKQ